MVSSPRPEAILADAILNAPVADERRTAKTFGKEMWPTLKKAVRSSQKFVLTQSAYQRIRDAMNATPEQLVHNAKFALPPHSATWLEVRGQTDAMGRNLHEDDAPNTGYLILDGTIYSFIHGVGRDTFVFTPWVVDLHTPPSREEQKTIMEQFGKDAEGMDRAFWGRLYNDIPVKLRPRLRQQHRVRMLPGGIVDPEHWRKLSGLDFNVRMVLATLLALNQPNHPLVYTLNNAQRRMTARGPMNFVEYNVVTVTLGGSRRVYFNYRHRGTGAGDSPYHDVEDHWMHFRTPEERTCTHGYGLAQDFWEPYGDGEKPRYRCTACGTRRIRRHYPNGWGDGSKGVRLHTHVVRTTDDN